MQYYTTWCCLLFQIGIAASYGVWAVSHNFALFVIARVMGGVSKGNVSLSTAIVSDVTKPSDRAKGMVCLCSSCTYIFHLQLKCHGVLLKFQNLFNWIYNEFNWIQIKLLFFKGFVVYFSYGIRNSKENTKRDQQNSFFPWIFDHKKVVAKTSLERFDK